MNQVDIDLVDINTMQHCQHAGSAVQCLQLLAPSILVEVPSIYKNQSFYTEALYYLYNFFGLDTNCIKTQPICDKIQKESGNSEYNISNYIEIIAQSLLQVPFTQLRVTASFSKTQKILDDIPNSLQNSSTCMKKLPSGQIKCLNALFVIYGCYSTRKNNKKVLDYMIELLHNEHIQSNAFLLKKIGGLIVTIFPNIYGSYYGDKMSPYGGSITQYQIGQIFTSNISISHKLYIFYELSKEIKNSIIKSNTYPHLSDAVLQYKPNKDSICVNVPSCIASEKQIEPNDAGVYDFYNVYEGKLYAYHSAKKCICYCYCENCNFDTCEVITNILWRNISKFDKDDRILEFW
jgi:hypothetical protein